MTGGAKAVIRSQLDAMQAAERAYDEATRERGTLTGHYDPQTGERRDEGDDAVAGVIAGVIADGFLMFKCGCGQSVEGSLDQIDRDLRDMARDLIRVADALASAAP